jgi:hypothetical protein
MRPAPSGKAQDKMKLDKLYRDADYRTVVSVPAAARITPPFPIKPLFVFQVLKKGIQL